MWTKIFLAACFVAPLLVLHAAEPEKTAKTPSGANGPEKAASSGTEPAAKEPVKPLTKKEREALLRELSAEAGRFNPKQPALTAAHVQKVLVKDVSDALIEKKIPEDPKKIKNSAETITFLSVRMALFKYGILLKNPELPEVTGIKLAWFQAYGEKLKKMEDLAKQLDQISVSGTGEQYAALRETIEKYQKELKDFAEARKPKLSPDEMRELRKQNMRWRTAEFKKYHAEKLQKAGLAPGSVKNIPSARTSSSSSASSSTSSSGTKKSSSTSASSSAGKKSSAKSSSSSNRKKSSGKKSTNRRSW